jgi:membrane associated rhomboid family serine protease
MNNAAVGFQCPSCVAEGRKATRSGRTPYGGLRPARAGLVTQVLIGINAAVWVLILATGASGSVWVDRLVLRPKGACLLSRGAFDVSQGVCTSNGGTWLPGVSDGAWWQPVTSMFTHVEVWHIGFNMVALWVLGSQLEMVLGRWRYLTVYLLSGLAGAAAVYWLSGEYTPTLGASGAIFGLMGALLVLAYKVHADMSQLMFWIAISVVYSVFGANVSWQDHLGGFVGGAVLAGIIVYSPRQHRTAWQVAGFGAVGVVTLLALAARTAALS